MKCPSKGQVLRLHEAIIARSGGQGGLRDEGALESALAQPLVSFAGRELYPGIVEKAAALCFSLVRNHSFIDGNKRIGHAVMVVFLNLNGMTVKAGIDEQERIILGVAAGRVDRAGLVAWLEKCVVSLDEE